MTEQELQLALTSMLSKKIYRMHSQIKFTEWLYICYLVEQSLTDEEKKNYISVIFNLHLQGGSLDGSDMVKNWFPTICLSWQERAEALCKVKGIA